MRINMSRHVVRTFGPMREVAHSRIARGRHQSEEEGLNVDPDVGIGVFLDK